MKFIEPTTPRRVLIVDDNQDAATSLGMLLRCCKHEVRIAFSGPQGLEVAKEFQPDVIVLDISMPQVSGYEVLNEIRASGWGMNMRVIALTGWGRAQTHDPVAVAKFDSFLMKPAEINELNQLIEKLCLSAMQSS